MPGALPALPSLSAQADRLIELGAHEVGGFPAAELRAAAADTGPESALLVMHPDRAPVSALVPLLEHGGKPGFVVADMTDVDQFCAVESAPLPAGPVYLIADLDRGDEMANWRPGEALRAITAAARTPLTLGEGIHWLLQQPEVLQRNHCFMTVGSRRRKANGDLDARTPALWISNGTGRDGAGNRGAPKVGWCWAGNRHSWLGFASAASRTQAAPG